MVYAVPEPPNKPNGILYLEDMAQLVLTGSLAWAVYLPIFLYSSRVT